MQITPTTLPLPSSPFTEEWIAVLISVLSVLYLLLLCFKPLHINQTLFIKSDGRKSLFEENELNERWSASLLTLFCGGTISLLYYALSRPAAAAFDYQPYLHTLGIFIIFALLKVITLKLIGYIFFNPLQQSIFFHNYQLLLYLSCTCLFPLVLAYLYLPEYLSVIGLILIGLALLIGTLLFIVKISQLFFQNIVAGFYILLYLCTLEILPYYGLFLWIEQEVWKV